MIVDFAPTPWSEIVPGLWQGGHDWRNPKTGNVERAIVGDEFDVVYSLYHVGGHGPSAGVDDIVNRIPDGELGDSAVAAVAALGRSVADNVRLQRLVLVRCQAGLNRSGLVVAYALIAMGHAPQDAIDLIRRQRSPDALTNKHFVRYLTTAHAGPTSAG